MEDSAPAPTTRTLDRSKDDHNNNDNDSRNSHKDKEEHKKQNRDRDMEVDDGDSDDENSTPSTTDDDDDDDDNVPLSHRAPTQPTIRNQDALYMISDSNSDEDYPLPPPKNRRNRKKRKNGNENASGSPPKKMTNVEEEEEGVWKWWEEAPLPDGVKWNYLQHKGPIFPPEYEPLPPGTKFRYARKPIKLSKGAEEVAGFYARFIENQYYMTKEKFNKNFLKDWRKSMTEKERSVITDLSKCDFREINEYYKWKARAIKKMTKEEKNKMKADKERLKNEHSFCIVDGRKEKLLNFKIEAPSLFIGTGDHPKMGMVKKRITPEDVIINCSKEAKIPVPPKGHKWKEVRHDNSVAWLACWADPHVGYPRYMGLNYASRAKSEKSWMKFEKARALAKQIDKIREKYQADFNSEDLRVRQRAVALYFMDKLDMKAGLERGEDHIDMIGVSSLRLENIKLHDEKDGKKNVVTIDIVGKDRYYSIRYFNEVPVEERVYENLKSFMENRMPEGNLFEKLTPTNLSRYLNELMDELTGSIFRTYHASHALQQQLDELTPTNGTVDEKLSAYRSANNAVAMLFNHLHKTSELTTRDKSSESLLDNSKQQEDAIKLTCLDPRISVAWYKKHEIPIEKLYTKWQQPKILWAIETADKHYRFD